MKFLCVAARERALIALLACSPNGERSRAWLQSMLWGRCGTLEAQGSLRQEVSRLRSIEELGDLIESTKLSIRLRRDRVVVDIDMQGALPAGDLLEGLDLPNEEAFEDWLREERGRLLARVRAPLEPAVPVIDRPVASSGKLCIALFPALVDETDIAIMREADFLLDTLAAALLQSGIVDIADIRDIDARLGGRAQVAPDVELRLRLKRSGARGRSDPAHEQGERSHIAAEVIDHRSGIRLFALPFERCLHPGGE